MIIAAAMEMPIGIPVDRLYEGPQTHGRLVPCRLMALRIATREEYVAYGIASYGDEFSINEDLARKWNHYYEVSID